MGSSDSSDEEYATSPPPTSQAQHVYYMLLNRKTGYFLQLNKEGGLAISIEESL